MNSPSPSLPNFTLLDPRHPFSAQNTTGQSQPKSSSSSSSLREDFISKENLCGGTLLRLVGRGSAIISELMHLSEQTPPVFKLARENDSTKDRNDDRSGGTLSSEFRRLFGVVNTRDTTAPSSPGQIESDNPCGDDDDVKYRDLLFDFAYLNSPEEHERRINFIPDNVELEAEFASSYRDVIVKFYNLFESMYRYHSDLNKFATDLSEGYYIQYTIDSVLLDETGGQLLCESVYLFGMMLLLMERHVPGPVRERIVIAYFRYCRKEGHTNIDQVCKLCRSTGRSYPSDAKPPKYEEKLFARLPFADELVRSVVGRLLSDDLYLLSTAFPNFHHRSTRLAKQASMLYVVLFFQSDILHSEMGTMREIVDKFFNDNWVVSLYMGMIVDLSVEWREFNAARTALRNVLVTPNVARLHKSNCELFKRCMSELDEYLTRDVLTDQYVIDHTNELLNCMRRCNVALQWRILHQCGTNPKFNSILKPAAMMTSRESTATSSSSSTTDSTLQDADIVSLLLQSSELETRLKDTFARLLRTKSEKWADCRSSAVEKMTELSKFFTGQQALANVRRNDGLSQWFSRFADEIRSLSYGGEEHSTVIGRKIQLCIQALEDVEQFDAIDRNLQVKSFLKDSRNRLLQMVRVVGWFDLL